MASSKQPKKLTSPPKSERQVAEVNAAKEPAKSSSSIEVPGFFRVKAGANRATAYRIHWVDGDGKPASDEALPALVALAPCQARRLAKRASVLKAYKRQSSERILSVEESSTPSSGTAVLEARQAFSVGQAMADTSTGFRENGQILPFSMLEVSSTHILHQRGVGQRGCAKCRALFQAGRVNQRYCSPRCRRAAENERAYGQRNVTGWWSSILPLVKRIEAHGVLKAA